MYQFIDKTCFSTAATSPELELDLASIYREGDLAYAKGYKLAIRSMWEPCNAQDHKFSDVFPSQESAGNGLAIATGRSAPEWVPVYEPGDFLGAFARAVVRFGVGKCPYCGSRSIDDTRGNCGACGAPRDAQE